MDIYQDLYKCIACQSNDLQIIDFVDSRKPEALVCQECNTHFIFFNNILRFVGKNNYSNTFGFEWNMHKKTQVDSNSEIDLSSERFFEVTGWSNCLNNELILEAGSGSGRFTEILAKTSANIVSFDYSNAIDVNYENNRKFKNIIFFQGDIFNIPLKENIFDKILCLGVIQHTPNPKKSINLLIKHLKPKGEIVFDVYRKDLKAMTQWKYLLRPITKKIKSEKLYKYIEIIVPKLLPITILLKKYFGRWGERMSPIADYSHLNIDKIKNLEWSILDTFDRYSPAFDNPLSLKEVKALMNENKLENIVVKKGPNGIVASGIKKS